MFYFHKWNKNPTECKDSFVRSMDIRRDEGYSRILQEMSTMDNFISRKIRVVDHRNRKYTSTQNCSVFKTDQINFSLTYNALLPVQRFFSPFWTRRRKFQRTTERCLKWFSFWFISLLSVRLFAHCLLRFLDFIWRCFCRLFVDN
jgi:hypothetical protein